MPNADLHLHTTSSDGTDTPTQIVRAAVDRGLQAIAITDHDVTSGLPEAVSAAKNYSLEIIPGVELNTNWCDKRIHLLGYFMDVEEGELHDKLEWLVACRLERARKMVEKLAEMAMPLDWDNVMKTAGPGAICRPHMAWALVEAGHVKTLAEAFDRYIGRGRPAYVKRPLFPIEDAIRSIRNAGGAAVLAHPVLIGDDSCIPELAMAGLAGIEALHPYHSEEDEAHYKALADRHGLVWTGGSDYHGWREARPFASRTAPMEQVEALRERARRG